MCYTNRTYRLLLLRIKEGIPLKYWRGYLTAAIFAAIAWALTTFAEGHRALVDMVYPYLTRLIQTTLAEWTGGVDFCLWQLLAVALGALLIASIVVMIALRWNFFQWLGWVAAAASCLWMLHTGVFGLNYYAGPLSDDIRVDTSVPGSTTDLVTTTTYFRDKANELALQIPRDADGNPDFPEFEELAAMAGNGFEDLTYRQSYSVFAGSTVPVKKLGWADMYTSMGITGFTFSLTGEAAVNPQIPAVSMPFVMCHEMAHRMCIANEADANLAGFLACAANEDITYQYSGYFMAFRYCYDSLRSLSSSTAKKAAKDIYAGVNEEFLKDMGAYNKWVNASVKPTASKVGTAVNDSYIKANGDSQGVKSYGGVTNLLVHWYVQEIYLPEHKDEEVVFDPYDKNQVDLTTDSGA